MYTVACKFLVSSLISCYAGQKEFSLRSRTCKFSWGLIFSLSIAPWSLFSSESCDWIVGLGCMLGHREHVRNGKSTWDIQDSTSRQGMSSLVLSDSP